MDAVLKWAGPLVGLALTAVILVAASYLTLVP